MRLTIEALAKQLEATQPGDSSWKIIPNLANDRTWHSFTIRTPFFYPFGERIFLNVEFFNRKENLVRLHDDEVTFDSLAYRDLGRVFLRSRKRLQREILAPAGLKLAAASNTISRTINADLIWSSIPPFASTLSLLVFEVEEARDQQVGSGLTPLIGAIFSGAQLAAKPA